MIFKFKFNLGQEVYTVNEMTKCEYKECLLCKNTGRLHIKEDPHHTVYCYGCKENRMRPYKRIKHWSVDERSLNIGQAKVEISDKEATNYRYDSIVEGYMCTETGVGSGTVHKVERLFPNKEDAQKFCDDENSRIDWEILE